MKINKQDSFNDFRDWLILGEKPIFYLEKKINELGYTLNDEDNYIINEDAFYLSVEDISRLIKNPNYKYARINSEYDMYRVSSDIKQQINIEHLKNGVRIINIDNTYIDVKIKIGKGSIIYPNSYLEKETIINENCIIGPDSKITNSIIGSDTKVLKSVIVDSEVGKNCNIGPYAYIRPESNIGNNVKIGDFVEIKKSIIRDKTKISHLAYIGDSEVGENCNIACGVITANYDGVKKYKTIIKEKAFIGCNVTMVAPIIIEKNAYIAAGSTITEDVPKKSLAIARKRQMNKENWVLKKENKNIEKQ